MMNELFNGTKLQNGRYKIDGKLGEGGFGITYSGTTKVKLTGNLGTSEVKTKVAIKEFFLAEKCKRASDGLSVIVPNEDLRGQVDKYKKKFRQEAVNLSKMQHSHIVSVSEVFDENGTVYYVMSLLSGGSLVDKVKNAPQKRLSEKAAESYMRQVADALSYIHEKKINHLDVKPANILLNDEEEAVLIDFGISKMFAEDETPTTQSVIYSNHYAPLEQYSPITDFSPQTDIYSLSATLYYLLTGALPPEASIVSNEGLGARPDYITLRMWNVIKKGMEPKKRDRPQTIQQWLSLLNDGESSEHSDLKEEPVDSGDDETREFDPTPDSTKTSSSKDPTKTDNPEPPNTRTRRCRRIDMKWINILAVLVLIAVGACAMWFLLYKKSKTPVTKKSYTATQVMTLLGRTDITKDSVELYMAGLDASNASQATIDSVNRRAYAMRQLLGPCFLLIPHKLADLKGIYVANDKYVSPAQREIFLWFFNRKIGNQKQWEKLNVPVTSLDDFKEKMERQFNN
jgi:serine/threonine protein kinase